MIQTKQVRIENGYLNICVMNDGSERVSAHKTFKSLLETLSTFEEEFQTPQQTPPLPELKTVEDDEL